MSRNILRVDRADKAGSNDSYFEHLSIPSNFCF
jgi:hypothetical protein